MTLTMPLLSPEELAKVLDAALREEGVTEDPPGSNGGKRVGEYQRVTGNKRGDAWCASFVNWCGVTTLGPEWPVLRSGGCAALGEWAKREGVRMLQPQVGDIGLLYFPKLHRFAHTFFITDPPDVSGKWGTVEGNTSGGGSREGWGVFRHRRAFGSNDRFIRLGTP